MTNIEQIAVTPLPDSYCFYKAHSALGTSGNLMWKHYDGTKWSAESIIAGGGMDSSPSAVFYGVEDPAKSKYYCFYNRRVHLFCNTLTFNATVWDGEEEISGIPMADGSTLKYGNAPAPEAFNSGCYPSAVIFNGVVYCFVAGIDSKLWCATQQPATGFTRWSFSRIDGTDANLAEGAGAVVFNNKIYLFYSNPGTYQMRYAYSSDGINWIGDQIVTGQAPFSGSPAAVVFQDKIYLFTFGNSSLWAYTFDGTNWNSSNIDYQVVFSSGDEPRSDQAPFARVYGSNLFLFYTNLSGQMCYRVYDGNLWQDEVNCNIPLDYHASVVMF